MLRNFEQTSDLESSQAAVLRYSYIWTRVKEGDKLGKY